MHLLLFFPYSLLLTVMVLWNLVGGRTVVENVYWNKSAWLICKLYGQCFNGSTFSGDALPSLFLFRWWKSFRNKFSNQQTYLIKSCAQWTGRKTDTDVPCTLDIEYWPQIILKGSKKIARISWYEEELSYCWWCVFCCFFLTVCCSLWWFSETWWEGGQLSKIFIENKSASHGLRVGLHSFNVLQSVTLYEEETILLLVMRLLLFFPYSLLLTVMVLWNLVGGRTVVENVYWNKSA